MNRFRRLCLIALGALLFAAPSNPVRPTSRPITDADSVVAIYNERFGITSQLVLAVWKDGHVVWSEDPLYGGAPYHAGRIEPKRLASFVSALDQDGLFAQQDGVVRLATDRSFTTILIRSGKKKIKMQSWHELAEGGGKLVVSSRGLIPLNGRPLFEALRGEPAEYLFFRFLWSEIRSRAAGLVPSAGVPVDGRVVDEYGGLSWQETLPASRTSE